MTVFRKAVSVQRDIETAFYNAIRGNEFSFPFPVEKCRGLQAVLDAIKNDGSLGIVSILKQRGILTNNSKTDFSLDAQIVNCAPSIDCRKYCYHAKQLLIYREYCVKCVMVDIAIRLHPEEMARAIVAEWEKAKYKPETLRIFGGGDFDNKGAYLRVIRLLNDAGIRCHIFSKKPDLLSLCDSRNIRLLSVDKSNIKKALSNNLPVAVVYTPGLYKNAIFQQLARAGRIQNVLPVQNGGFSIVEMVSELMAHYPQLYARLCPCDSNLDGIHKCSCCDNCNDMNGRGCYNKQTSNIINFHR